MRFKALIEISFPYNEKVYGKDKEKNLFKEILYDVFDNCHLIKEKMIQVKIIEIKKQNKKE